MIRRLISHVFPEHVSKNLVGLIEVTAGGEDVQARGETSRHMQLQPPEEDMPGLIVSGAKDVCEYVSGPVLPEAGEMVAYVARSMAPDDAGHDMPGVVIQPEGPDGGTAEDHPGAASANSSPHSSPRVSSDIPESPSYISASPSYIAASSSSAPLCSLNAMLQGPSKSGGLAVPQPPHHLPKPSSANPLTVSFRDLHLNEIEGASAEEAEPPPNPDPRLSPGDVLRLVQRTLAPQMHFCATILFADLVGFTPLASQVEPSVLLQFLDRFFGEVDELCRAEAVENIKTIGDCYMCVGWAEDVSSPVVSASRVLAVATRMHRIVQRVPLNGKRLSLRAGVCCSREGAGGASQGIASTWGGAPLPPQHSGPDSTQRHPHPPTPAPTAFPTASNRPPTASPATALEFTRLPPSSSSKALGLVWQCFAAAVRRTACPCAIGHGALCSHFPKAAKRLCVCQCEYSEDFRRFPYISKR